MLYVHLLILLILRALKIPEQKNISNSIVMPYSDEFILRLEELAIEYVKECLSHTKEVVSNKGQIVYVQDRHIPTIGYFLRIWIPIVKDDQTISRDTYYRWLKDTDGDPLRSDTIKKINEMFNNLAKDIVANEGKGIFYAKNALNMHDKQHIENKQVEKFDFDI